MISIYRRHDPKRCNLTLRTQIKCKCRIWAAGMDADGHKVREALRPGIGFALRTSLANGMR
jgi:hypothetical protein